MKQAINTSLNSRKDHLCLFCSKCQKNVYASIVGGEKIYPHRPDLKDRLFAECPYCGQYVGIGNRNEREKNYKGWRKNYNHRIIPTPELRDYRKKIHGIIDAIWKQGIIPRREIYRRLSEATGIHGYHNGSLKDVETAKKALSEAIKLYNEASIRASSRNSRRANPHY